MNRSLVLLLLMVGGFLVVGLVSMVSLSDEEHEQAAGRDNTETGYQNQPHEQQPQYEQQQQYEQQVKVINWEHTISYEEYVAKGDTFEYPGFDIPIHYDNPLWKDPENEEVKRMSQTFVQEVNRKLKGMNPRCDQEKMWEVLDEYFPVMGINNMMTTIEKAAEEGVQGMVTESLFWHEFGGYVFKKADRINHAVEIAATLKMHGAVLHGSVWSYIRSLHDKSPIEMMELTTKDVCFFNWRNRSEIYSSCVHGMGHGLLKLFDFNYESAMELCDLGPTMGFKYSCSSGVYMDLLQAIPKTQINTWWPCDVGVNPATCFKYKQNVYRMFPVTSYPCLDLSDTYHQVGCAWAEGVLSRGCTHYYTALRVVSSLEDKNHIQILIDACEDGNDVAVHVGAIKGVMRFNPEEREQRCDMMLKNGKIKYNICLPENQELFGVEGRWHSILEQYRDPNVIPQPAPWTSETRPNTWGWKPDVKDPDACVPGEMPMLGGHNHHEEF